MTTMSRRGTELIFLCLVFFGRTLENRSCSRPFGKCRLAAEVEVGEIVEVEAKATQGGAKKQNKRREEGAIGQRGTGGRR
jgi:hypothetical protein